MNERLDPEQLKMKAMLAASERHALPAEIHLQLSAQLVRRPAFWQSLWILKRPTLWVPVAVSAVALALFAGVVIHQRQEQQLLPLEPLLAAHSRYSADRSMLWTDLSVSEYSVHLADYEDTEG